MAVSSARRRLPPEDAQRPLALSFHLTRSTTAAAAGSGSAVRHTTSQRATRRPTDDPTRTSPPPPRFNTATPPLPPPHRCRRRPLQSYDLWRTVYRITRRVQGRLNDLMLVAAAHAERDPATNDVTPRALAGIEVRS